MKKHHFVFYSILILALASCASTKKADDIDHATASITEVEQALPKIEKVSYFSRIDADAFSLAKDASPSSIKKTFTLLRKSELDYSDAERTLLYVLDFIMKFVWQSETLETRPPKLNSESLYTGALQSVRNGIYDLSTGDKDFFALVIPSLIIVKTENVSSFAKDAETALKAALKLEAHSTLAHYLLGLLYKKQNHVNEALNEFSKAQESSPLCMEVLFQKANCLLSLGKKDEAMILASSLLVQHPSNISILKLCAELSFALNDYAAAEEYVARVLQQTPNDLQYILFRAKILVQKNDYIKALSLLDVYARQDESNLEYLLLRSRVQFYWSKNATAAISTIEKALTLYPENIDVLLFASRLSKEANTNILGKSTEEFAEKVLARDSQNIEAKRYQIAGMMKNKKWQTAYNENEKLFARTLDKDELFAKINICIALGKLDEAFSAIAPVYARESTNDDVVQAYILVLTKMKRESEALSIINARLPASNSTMKSFFYYARSFLTRNEESALSDLRSSLIANPRNSDSLFRLYEIYLSKNDYRRAQYYLRQVAAIDPNNQEIIKLVNDLEGMF